MTGFLRFFTLLFITVIISNPSISQKARYQSEIIYYLSHHVTWPDKTEGYKFVIGVIGTRSDFLSFQEFALEKKEIQGRPIEVRYYSCTNEINDCDMIYISEDCRIDIDKIIKKTKREPVLLISGKDGYGQMGSVVNFIEQNDKLRIELNEKQAIKRGLTISDKLRSIAILI